MEIVFDKKRLLPLLRDFHTITGLRVGVFDLACKEVAAYPVKLSGFCRLIRSRPEGLERCLACDRAALELSGKRLPEKFTFINATRDLQKPPPRYAMERKYWAS